MSAENFTQDMRALHASAAPAADVVNSYWKTVAAVNPTMEVELLALAERYNAGVQLTQAKMALLMSEAKAIYARYLH